MTERWQWGRAAPTGAQPLASTAALLDLPELAELRALLAINTPQLRSRTLCEVNVGPCRLPVPLVTLGSERPDAPVAAFFGGVHGLERIGSQVVLAYLRSLLMRLPWDEGLQRLLEQVRLVFMPIVNPGGLWLGTRANPNGVDLMRCAPIDAQAKVAPLVGGHRISPALPWYRGRLGAAMEPEGAALCEVVDTELLGRPFAIALDCHSGFGMADRLWFPWASSREPIEHLPEVHALGQILDQSLLHHRYLLEPQSRQYLAHGDLWDHLYQRAATRGPMPFLPLTLEMGSWLWIKKNPRQLFSRRGIFNPEQAHRQQRVLRRHLSGLDFIARAAANWQRWAPQGEARTLHREQALARWYGGRT
jgi:hypothetical protein